MYHCAIYFIYITNKNRLRKSFLSVTADARKYIMTEQGQVPPSYVITVTKAKAQHVRARLTNKGIFDSNRKIRENATGKDELEIPVNSIKDIGEILHDIQFSICIAAEEDLIAEQRKISMFDQLIHHFKQVHDLFHLSKNSMNVFRGLVRISRS